MVNYILRRLLLMPITLIGITIMVFLIARFAPGSPALMQASDGALDAETQKAILEWYERRYGLNLPLPLQYARWWKGLVTRNVQAVSWTDEEQARPIFTLRRTDPEYFVRFDDGSWQQVVDARFLPGSHTVDDAEFAAMLREGELERHHPPKLPGYTTPTHLLIEGDLVAIESLDADMQAARLKRAVDLTRITIDVVAPAWTDSGEPLFVYPSDPLQPLFQRGGEWFVLPVRGLDAAEIKPINDASVASRMGRRFDELPQDRDGYALPRHAFFFGTTQRVEPPADPSSLERLVIPTTARSPSGVWVQLPESDRWGMLWEAAEPQPVMLAREPDGSWRRLIGTTRVVLPDVLEFRQTDERLRSRLGTTARSEYPAVLDESVTVVPRHAVFSGTFVDSTFQPGDRDVRRYFHQTWIFELTLGESARTRTTVMEELKRRLPVTLLLNLIAFPLIYAIAIPTGMLMAVKRGRKFDAAANIVLLGFWSVPTVLSATLLLGYLARGGAGFEWFPNNGLSSAGVETWPFLGYFADDGTWVNGWLIDRIWHLILPILCITYGGLAYLAKQMRAAMLDNFTMDYVRTAKAKGVRFKDIVFRHVLRNSLLPLITIFATILPALIAGSIIIEKIFNINGMGLMVFEAVQSRDYDVVQSIALIAGALNLTGLLIADLCYALADPRITYS